MQVLNVSAEDLIENTAVKEFPLGRADIPVGVKDELISFLTESLGGHDFKRPCAPPWIGGNDNKKSRRPLENSGAAAFRSESTP
jgi:hypothetical protein